MILVLTYGKVCSTSLYTMLRACFPGEVYYAHVLQDRLTRVVADFLDHARTDTSGLRNLMSGNGPIHARLDEARRNGEPIHVICAVRDPIERSLSGAIQALPMLFEECISADPRATAAHLANRLADLWMHDRGDEGPLRRMVEASIRGPLSWLAEEIEAPFGLDLRGVPFDTERGYAVFENGPVRLLLFRHENVPGAVEEGLSRLFPGRTFVLPRLNAGAEKPWGEVYRHLREAFRLPAATLQDIYADPYVRHYYTDAERSAAIRRWSAEQRPVLSPPRLRFRATVVLPLLNQRQWVKQNLESLLGQWREDVELLVVDDGSSDDGFDVVQRTLAGRRGVHSILLRNEHSRGAEIFSQVVQYSNGEVLIEADGDDISLPGRLGAILSAFDADPRCRMVTTNALLVTSSGLPIGLYDSHHADLTLDDPLAAASQFGSGQWLGASMAVHRSLLETFPATDAELCPYGLDLVVPFRAVLTGTHQYLATPLVGWRQHARNTHRMVGTGATDGELGERFGALELMTLAQKIRDAAFVQQNSADPARLAPVVERCRQLFFERFTEWSRVRNRWLRAAEKPVESSAAVYVPPVPPIATLCLGQRHHFGAADPLGVAAGHWSGIHAPEASWNWTSACALLVCRIAEPAAQGIRVSLVSLPASLAESQWVRLSANGADWQELPLRAGEQTTVELSLGPRGFPGHLTLLILAPHACVPAETPAGIPDTRRLGVSLRWIELV